MIKFNLIFFSSDAYLKIFIYFLTCLVFVSLLALIVWVFVPKKYRYEKNSVYECGFESFGSSKFNFNVHFFIVAILFIIFDVEIIFLYPWLACLNMTGFFGFFIMLIFLLVLAIGFAYEWKKGILDWKKYNTKKIN